MSGDVKSPRTLTLVRSSVLAACLEVTISQAVLRAPPGGMVRRRTSPEATRFEQLEVVFTETGHTVG